MQARVEALEAAVSALSAEVRFLRSFLGIDAGEGFQVIPTTPPAIAQAASLGSASFTTPVAQQSAIPQYPLQGPRAQESPLSFGAVARLPESQASAPSDFASAALSPRSRGAACREVGLWLRRALQDEHRGPSGRERLPSGLRYWLVARDHSGRDCNPVLVCSSFAQCKELCKRGSDLGQAVFIGLPNRGDVEAAAHAAGLVLPANW